MGTKIVKTYRIRIYLGLRQGYSKKEYSVEKAEKMLQKYCNIKGFCVTVTPTKFIYKNGFEKGLIIGIINYPRFPKTKKELKSIAIEIAKKLQDKFKQIRISVVCDDETIMINKGGVSAFESVKKGGYDAEGYKHERPL